MARRERGQVSCTRLERRNSENSPRIGIRESCFAPERGPGTHAVLRIHCRHQRVSACERESVCVAGNRVGRSLLRSAGGSQKAPIVLSPGLCFVYPFTLCPPPSRGCTYVSLYSFTKHTCPFQMQRYYVQNLYTSPRKFESTVRYLASWLPIWATSRTMCVAINRAGHSQLGTTLYQIAAVPAKRTPFIHTHTVL